MSVITRFERALLKFARPLDYIEAVVSGVVFASLAVLALHSQDPEQDAGTVVQVLADSHTLWIMVAILIPVLIFHASAFVVGDTERSYILRSWCLFTYAVTYLFIAVLTLAYAGFDHLVWVQTLGLAAVTGLLYLHVRVQMYRTEESRVRMSSAHES